MSLSAKEHYVDNQRRMIKHNESICVDPLISQFTCLIKFTSSFKFSVTHIFAMQRLWKNLYLKQTPMTIMLHYFNHIIYQFKKRFCLFNITFISRTCSILKGNMWFRTKRLSCFIVLLCNIKVQTDIIIFDSPTAKNKSIDYHVNAKLHTDL